LGSSYRLLHPLLQTQNERKTGNVDPPTASTWVPKFCECGSLEAHSRDLLCYLHPFFSTTSHTPHPAPLSLLHPRATHAPPLLPPPRSRHAASGPSPILMVARWSAQRQRRRRRSEAEKVEDGRRRRRWRRQSLGPRSSAAWAEGAYERAASSSTPRLPLRAGPNGPGGCNRGKHDDC
jgi:hypothetical protein